MVRSVAPHVEFLISPVADVNRHVKSRNWTMLLANPRAANASMVLDNK
jgi:hypothetical protein